MTTAATSLLGLALPVTGELSGTWGDTVNNSITALLDSAVAGTTTLSADVDVTLTTTTLAANQAREAIILWTAAGTVTRYITAPAQSKIYAVLNKSSTQSIVLRGVGPTTGVTILAGKQAMVAWDGTDYVEISSGYVDGPATSTDNAVARFDGTDGKLLQNSVVIIADTTGNMTGVGTLSSGAITSSALTATRVLFAGTSGLIQDDADLTFNGTILTSTGFAGPLNGTVGATTPAAGSFTNITGSANAIISVTDNTNAALRITQLGTGNALLVEDEANPDASPVVIDNSGRTILGNTSSISVSGTAPPFQVHTPGAGASYTRWSSNASGFATTLAKSRSTTIGTYSIVSNADQIGVLNFVADDGTGFVTAASIVANVDGTPGTNDMPGRLIFSTTADGASSPTERMRIDSAGQSKFSYNAVIEVTDNTNAALRITQLGTGNALLVEDSANPDSSPTVIDASGNLIVGYTSRVSSTSLIEAHSAASVSGAPAIATYSWDAANAGGMLALYKSQSDVVGTRALVSSGATSDLRFYFDDGVTFQRGASISGTVDGTPALNSMPGRLVFSTTADGASSPTERMRIDSSGDVGIGTTAPVVKLEIAGNNNTLWIVTASISGVTMDVTAVSSGTIAVGDLVYGTNIQPYTRVTALGTGTGGVGTYTVSVYQTVASSATTYGTTQYGATLIRITDIDTNQAIGQPNGALQFFTSDASTPTAGVSAYVAALAESVTPDTALVFGTRNNAGGGVDANERMRIDSDGNVGIGTNLPGAKLDVVGTAAISGAVTLSGGTANGVTYLNGSKVLTSGTALTFDGTNFGVGTTSPGNKLSVSNGGASGVEFNPTTRGGGAGGAFLLSYNRSAGAYQQFEYDALTHVWLTSNTEAMRLTSTGLGIGTSSPGERLHVSNSSAADVALQVQNNTHSSYLRSDGTGTQIGTNSATKPIYFYVGAAQRLTLDSSGNLGLGTTNPSAEVIPGLVIGNGTDNKGIVLFGTTTSQQNIVFTDTTASTRGIIQYDHGGDYMRFFTAGTDRMRIDSSGNLGLGVTPSAWFSVYKAIQIGSSNPAAVWCGGYDLNVGANIFQDGSGTYKQIGATYKSALYKQFDSAHSWYITTNVGANTAVVPTQAMTLDASGNLGIGTPLPGVKLDVRGTSNTAASTIQIVGNTVSSLLLGQNADGGVIRGQGGNNALTFWTGGSGDTGAGQSGSEKMRLDTSGNLLVGTTVVPVGNRTNGHYFYADGGYNSRTVASKRDWGISVTSGAIVNFYSDNGSAAVYAGSIDVNGNVTSYTSVSDYRLKENVVPMSNALANVMALNPVTYTFKNGGQPSQGFIAHELQAVMPECVTGEKDAVKEDGSPAYQGVDTSFLVATLTAAIQEQQAMIEDLKTRLAVAGI